MSSAPSVEELASADTATGWKLLCFLSVDAGALLAFGVWSYFCGRAKKYEASSDTLSHNPAPASTTIQPPHSSCNCADVMVSNSNRNSHSTLREVVDTPIETTTTALHTS